MSFDISLEDMTSKVVQVPHFQEGGTQVMGGSTDAELNVTYNYALVANLAGVHIRGLDGSTAKDTTAKLRRAVELLGTNQHDDYWADTSGNVGHALNILWGWALEHPEAKWNVS